MSMLWSVALAELPCSHLAGTDHRLGCLAQSNLQVTPAPVTTCLQPHEKAQLKNHPDSSVFT